MVKYIFQTNIFFQNIKLEVEVRFIPKQFKNQEITHKQILIFFFFH